MAQKQDKQPGVIIYGETIRMLRRQRDKNPQMALDLVIAMYEYAVNGIEPQFVDDVSASLWDLLADKVDRDKERYCTKRDKNRYKGFCTSCTTKGVEPIPEFETWLEIGMPSNADKYIQWMANAPKGEQMQPTTNTITAVTENTTTNVAADVAVAATVAASGAAAARTTNGETTRTQTARPEKASTVEGDANQLAHLYCYGDSYMIQALREDLERYERSLIVQTLEELAAHWKRKEDVHVVFYRSVLKARQENRSA